MNENSESFDAIIETGLVSPFIDISTDLAEIAIDKILVDGILKELPIVKGLTTITKGVFAVKDLYFNKKILVFFQELHNDTLNDKEYEEFINKFRNDKSYRDNVVEQIVILNDRFIDTYKSKILANLLKAHIYHKIDFTTFMEISQALESVNTKGLKVMTQLNKLTTINEQTYQNTSNTGESIRDGFFLLSAGLGYLVSTRITRLNKLGVCLLKYGIEKDFSFTYIDE